MFTRFIILPVVVGLMLTSGIPNRPNEISLTIDDSALPENVAAEYVPIRFVIPPEMLERIGGNIGSLAIYDDSESAVEYAVEEGDADAGISIPEEAAHIPIRARSVKSMQHSDHTQHVFQLETMPDVEIRAVTLEISEDEFDADVSISVSENSDDPAPSILVKRTPIFRRPTGELLHVNLSAVQPGSYLHVTVRPHDRRKPVAVKGMTALAMKKGAAMMNGIELPIEDVTDGPEETWIRTRMPSSHLRVKDLFLELSNLSSSRAVDVFLLSRHDKDISYQSIGSGMAGPSDDISVVRIPVNATIASAEITISIQNGRERPPRIRALRAVTLRPFILMKHRPGASHYRILFGGEQSGHTCVSGAALRRKLSGAPAFTLSDDAIRVGSESRNPDYQAPPDVVEAIPEKGGTIATEYWSSRKAIRISSPGILRIDLDAEAIAGAQMDGRDYRVVENNIQIPYLLLRSGIPDVHRPEVKQESAERISRWILTLPAAPLPITHITARASSPIFKRKITVFENIRDQAGKTQRKVLGEEVFARSGTEHGPELVLKLKQYPRTAALSVEIDNGDNAPLALNDFRVFHPAAHLLLKKNTPEPCWLYFGNADAKAPSYDIEMVSAEIIAARPGLASLGPLEIVNRPPWWKIDLEGPLAFWAYWAALAVVAAGLILVIVKLLPKEDSQETSER